MAKMVVLTSFGTELHNMAKSVINIFIEFLTFGALLKTSQFTNLDEAYYITAFVMFVQALFNTIKYLEKGEVDRTRFIVSLVSSGCSVIGGFICFVDCWKWDLVKQYSQVWHSVILILLFIAYLRMFLEDILPFCNHYKKITDNNKSAEN